MGHYETVFLDCDKPLCSTPRFEISWSDLERREIEGWTSPDGSDWFCPVHSKKQEVPDER